MADSPRKTPASVTLEDRRLVSLPVAADTFSISVKVLRRAQYKGQLPTYRLGRSVRVRLEDVEALFRVVGGAA